MSYAVAFDAIELAALGALRRFDSARELIGAVGCAGLLFRNRVAAEIATATVEDRDRLDIGEWDVDEAIRAIELADRFAPATEALALRIVGRLIEDRAALWLPPTLAWGADALIYGWRGVADVRREVETVFQLALGERRAA